MKASVELEQENLLSRREAILRLGALLGGVSFVGGNRLLAAVERARPILAGGAIGAFRVQDVEFLDEVAETILPATKTPGAKEAKTGAFMAMMVTDCYTPEQQKVFYEGMGKIDDACKRYHNVAFMEATPQQRLAVFNILDEEQKKDIDARDETERQRKSSGPIDKLVGTIKHGSGHDATPPHYFRMMKDLTLLGYFTSEIGCTQAMRYIESPGRFDPCLPYTAGDQAWAQHA